MKTTIKVTSLFVLVAARLMKSRCALLLLIAALTIPAFGCDEEGAAPSRAEARSDKERVTDPAVGQEQLEQLVEGNGAFAFDLYRVLSEEEGNLFFSPYSIWMALAMTHAGARGGTEGEMAEALSYTLPQEELHRALNALDLQLAERGQDQPEEEGDPFRLNIANSLWGQTGYEFLSQFLDTLAENYGAGLRLVDFERDPDGSRTTINRWVAEQTNDRIPELIPKGLINNLTRLVLTNAIYFKASWAFPFAEGRTGEAAFHLLDGGEVSVPMMNLDETLSYADLDGIQAVKLPYVGQQISMVVLVPDEGEFGTFESTLEATTIRSVLNALKSERVLLAMPKFSFESGFELASTLEGLGMHSAFEPEDADFSGMDGTRDLYIDRVIHEAFVSVDEAGTEAAAATAVIMGETASQTTPPPPIELTIDRPFVFVIHDESTGATLFVGRVVDPPSQ